MLGISSLALMASDVMRYSGGIIDWTKEELQDMDRKIRKIMTVNRCFRPKSSVARLYMKRKEGGRGLISVEDYITTEMRELYDYLTESNKEDILSGVLKDNVIEEGYIKEEFTKMKRDERKKTSHEGKL